MRISDKTIFLPYLSDDERTTLYHIRSTFFFLLAGGMGKRSSVEVGGQERAIQL
jgi:hypothetical protein